MQIKGFQGTSLLDFPGRISALVYTGGCNLRCAFCHNPGLVLDPDQYPDFPLPELYSELQKRKVFIDGVVVSGGEPTLERGLKTLLTRIKELGLQVKLDTNGLQPKVLADLLECGLLDYLAIDLKTAPRRYSELHSAPVDVGALLESCQLAMTSAPEYEFRTTCVPGLVTDREIVEMGEVIRGGRSWVLQQYVPRAQLLGRAPAEAYPMEVFEHFQKLAASCVVQVVGRGW
ncbi:anaerobic ribonucleoside-triphosphate reductase activating protein [Geopsychrobacter electrodiphilus]|uniref:anaerobic ribonucleoside-triphosphate reductase activating protein n=1 Tax=Geopsychrobacter electrodiphilus TaxID=225196 RepID=UPI00036093A4|nr:anaerobic ribonucleoside-triphosphate reductase activating protein [Geopsychrobacter electrodiphilus]